VAAVQIDDGRDGKFESDWVSCGSLEANVRVCGGDEICVIYTVKQMALEVKVNSQEWCLRVGGHV
jgi:hypothetical protein